MKVKSRKFQIAITLGIFWFVVSPAFLYFSALNGLNVKSHPCFEKSDLGKSVFDLETSKKTLPVTFIIHGVLRSELLRLMEVWHVFPRVSSPNSNFLILRC